MYLYTQLVYIGSSEGVTRMSALKKTMRKNTTHAKARRLKNDRLNMRIDETSKAKLERAASYHLESVSDYVIARALQAAEADISTHEHIVLDKPVWDIFFNALNNPPKTNPRLKALLKRHDQEIVSR
jgi:uncharacterized protein (DUF1778 family)